MANCAICGAPPMFKRGDRVALNAVWMKHSGGMGRNIGDRATVLGLSRTENCVRLVFDDRKTPCTYHQTFLRGIR